MLRKSNTPEEVAEIISKTIINTSEKEQVPFEMVVGIIEAESLFNPMVESKAGAKGLMQILVEDGIEIDENKAFSINYNVQIGIQIFKSKLGKANGDLRKTLCFYSGHAAEYEDRVFNSMGRFLLFRMNGELEKNGTESGTEESMS